MNNNICAFASLFNVQIRLTKPCTKDTFVTWKLLPIVRFQSNITKIGAVQTQKSRDISDNQHFHVKFVIYNLISSYNC